MLSLVVAICGITPIAAQEAPQHVEPTHAEMGERLAACGLAAIAISFNDDLRRDVAIITDPQVSEEQLQCTAAASWETFYIVVLKEPYDKRYYEIIDQLARPMLIARSRAFFAQRPALGAPPERAADESDLSLTKRIETFCGAAARGAFAMEFGILTLSSDWQSGLDIFDEKSVEALGCVINAALLADVTIGFVGNEKEMKPEEEVHP